jgi:hypothetical protein
MQLSRWVVVLLLAAGCSGPAKPPTGPTPITPAPTPTPTPTVNNPPRITAIAVSSMRVEVGTQITLTASVADDETASDQLKYEWAPSAGTMTGTGRTVQWTAPSGIPTPATFTISLTVVDQYTSGQQTLEHRITAQSAQIVVEDSFDIVQRLSEKFLANFSNSKVTPQICVEDFLDTGPCVKGRASELKDIADNRATREILNHSVVVTRVDVNATRDKAEVLANCRFTSRIKATDALEYANGICELDLVYDKNRWWLCTSSYHAIRSSLGLLFQL